MKETTQGEGTERRKEGWEGTLKILRIQKVEEKEIATENAKDLLLEQKENPEDVVLQRIRKRSVLGRRDRLMALHAIKSLKRWSTG